MFPPYLDHKDAHDGEGESSSGLAVLVLKCLLFDTKYYRQGNFFIIDTIFDDRLIDAIKALQRDLGFTGKDVDGCFGQGTRAKLKQRADVDIDVDAIPDFGIGVHTKARMPDGDLIDWPPAPKEAA